MDWNRLFNSRWLRLGVCLLLILAILLALCRPGLHLHTRELENPLDGNIQEICSLELGNADDSASLPGEPEEDPTEPETPQESKPEESQPEESDETDNTPPNGDGDDTQKGTDPTQGNDSGSGEPEEDVPVPDVALSFAWVGKNTGKQTLICTPGGAVLDTVKTVALSGGRISCTLSLTGTDSSLGHITKVTYLSQSGNSGSLSAPNDTLPMELPEGAVSNCYTVTVTALVDGSYVTFTVYLYLTYDVRLQMTCLVESALRTETCEAGCSATAQVIYDDQLSDGLLEYEMTLVGTQAEGLTIQSVTCYHSGNNRTETLTASGSTTLLLKNGKTGENTFTVKATDGEGNVYTFTLNIPYKHRGENTVQIYSSLQNGDTVHNETANSLKVYAYSENGNGEKTYIFNDGTNAQLRVELDGEVVSGLKSGNGYEYTLYPGNPQTGDTNTHTLYIYAEDAYGNYGELTLILNGRRNEAGQKIGKATIQIDLTSLGLGIAQTLSYDVLADEPVSYVVEKAVGGKDMGDIFGSASDTLGWAVAHGGTYDIGYYLQSISTGLSPNALEGSTWPGSTEEEVLAVIDARFGKGTGLATLWRCIYRNGVNKSTGSGGNIGEFDYTTGSGWVYAINSGYYPGQSMSYVYLKDGDTLTLRFTLAYGWDVGSGSVGYGNTVGYCVTAVNGSFHISHQMETVTNADGTTGYVCHCCGLAEDCTHVNTAYQDLQDGTHILCCEDCNATIGDPQEHIWGEDADCHICSLCGCEEAHIWQEVEGSNTATCTESGEKTEKCAICGMERQVSAAVRGHTYNNRWNYTPSGHYRACSVCGEKFDQGAHSYVYDADWDDYECIVCGVLHDWDVECDGKMTIVSATCQKVVYRCDGCDCTLTKNGDFEEYHVYDGGFCRHCGKKDPEGTEPEPTD